MDRQTNSEDVKNVIEIKTVQKQGSVSELRRVIFSYLNLKSLLLSFKSEIFLGKHVRISGVRVTIPTTIKISKVVAFL